MRSLIVLLTCAVYVRAGPVDMEDQQCGIEESSSSLHQNPWLAFLEYYKEGSKTWTRCAGTLIGSSFVVTAAHCVRSSSYTSIKVRLGEYNVTSKLDCLDNGQCADPSTSIEVDQKFVHPAYQKFASDIAVLKLKQPAPYTDFIRPICLPTNVRLEEHKTWFTAAGWGEIEPGIYSDVKKHIHLPYRSLEKCLGAYKHTSLPNNIICAGGERGIDTCRGDSGGSLTLKVEGRFELWGITSAGNPHCGTAGFPGVYTRVGDYLDWLREIMGKSRR